MSAPRRDCTNVLMKYRKVNSRVKVSVCKTRRWSSCGSVRGTSGYIGVLKFILKRWSKFVYCRRISKRQRQFICPFFGLGLYKNFFGKFFISPIISRMRIEWIFRMASFFISIKNF